MNYVDNFLNKITMYKLVLYSLFVLVGVSVVLGFLKFLPYGGFSLIFSFLTLTTVCYLSNIVIAKIFNVQTNVESSSISALILFFVLSPLSGFADLKIYIVVSLLAMLSKYFLTINKKHVFNPVAIALVIVGLFGSGVGSWWVGGNTLLLPVVIAGFLVLRKVRRFELFFAFIVSSLASMTFFGFIHGISLTDILISNFVSGPAIFFGSIMLTEPLTTPPTKRLQVVYGILTGIFFGAQFGVGPLYSTPGLALIIGNIFSFYISPRARLVLVLKEKNKLTNDVYEFVWRSAERLKFKSGQYLEWTLGHKYPDNRGNRRYFTISSSPTEDDLRLGIKFYDNPSSFKQRLLEMNVGENLIASQLSGEFTMPDDKSKKMVWIAGGIGVTPFRSMAKYLSDKKERREVTLFFSNRTPKDIVYKNIFDEAEINAGVKTLYAVNDLAGETQAQNMRVGFINADMISKDVPDYKDRIFYISGPHGMVSAFEDTLSKMGVPSSHIKVDFFPGFV